MFENLFQRKQLIAISFPGKFYLNFSGGVVSKSNFLVRLYLKGDRRSYEMSLEPKYAKQINDITDHLDYWVATGYFTEPKWDAAFDWKVSPRDLKKRYLASLIKE